MSTLIVKVVSNLARSTDPLAAQALQDLKSLENSIDSMQDGVSGYLQTGKHQLMAMAEIEHMINSSLGLDRVLEGVMDAVVNLMNAERGFL
ncbi:MAG: hypothetical protein WCO67_22095, partial [Betaproteobacteria bacterium]